MNLARKLRELWNMRRIVMPIVKGALGTVLKGLKSGLEELKIRTNRDHRNYSIVEIG